MKSKGIRNSVIFLFIFIIAVCPFTAAAENTAKKETDYYYSEIDGYADYGTYLSGLSSDKYSGADIKGTETESNRFTFSVSEAALYNIKVEYSISEKTSGNIKFGILCGRTTAKNVLTITEMSFPQNKRSRPVIIAKCCTIMTVY